MYLKKIEISKHIYTKIFKLFFYVTFLIVRFFAVESKGNTTFTYEIE